MECLRCGNPLLESDVECLRCGEKTAKFVAPPSTTTQKVTNMMGGKGKPVTAVVRKVHITPVQYTPASGDPNPEAVLIGQSVPISANITGAMIIGMLAAIILFTSAYLPIIGIKIEIPGMGNVYNETFNLMNIEKLMTSGKPFVNMFGLENMLNSAGIPYVFLRYGSMMVMGTAVLAFILSFIRLYWGLAICGISTIIFGAYGIFGYYRLVASLNELANKGNDPASGAPIMFNPASLIDMVHLQYGLWVLILAGILMLIAAFFPRAD